MVEMNRQWRLARRPDREVTPDCFEWVERPIEPLEAGQVRVRNHWLSLDPYMRGRWTRRAPMRHRRRLAR